MEIHVDYNPIDHIPKNCFFISVHQTKKECISFDNTFKGHRIIKQVLIEKRRLPKDKKLSSKWFTIIIKNKKFLRTYKVKWIDMNEKDWLNNEIWETTWEKPISKKVSKKLLFYSQLISDNYKDLNNFRKELNEFEQILKEQIKERVPDHKKI
jgi:hypothetical protein